MEITGEMIRQEAKECDARKVAQARRMGPRELFFAGAELFDDACDISLAGLKAQYPSLSQDELRTKLKSLIRWSEEVRK